MWKSYVHWSTVWSASARRPGAESAAQVLDRSAVATTPGELDRNPRMMKKILIVDDSATVRRQVRLALSGHPFDVIEASDGVEGAETINGSADLAAVILDINMPRMNGLEMLALIKRVPKNGALPVVMLTVEAQNELIQRAKASGANGWIVKPFKPEMLLAAMRKLSAL